MATSATTTHQQYSIIDLCSEDDEEVILAPLKIGCKKPRLTTNSPSKVEWFYDVSPTIILTMRRSVEMKLIISPNNKEQVLIAIRDETVRRNLMKVGALLQSAMAMFPGEYRDIFLPIKDGLPLQLVLNLRGEGNQHWQKLIV